MITNVDLGAAIMQENDAEKNTALVSLIPYY
jgi:hypothetical protein